MSAGRARIAAGYVVQPGTNTVHTKDCEAYEKRRGLTIMWGFAFSKDTACTVCLPDGLPVFDETEPVVTSSRPPVPQVQQPKPAPVISPPVQPTALTFEQFGFEISPD